MYYMCFTSFPPVFICFYSLLCYGEVDVDYRLSKVKIDTCSLLTHSDNKQPNIIMLNYTDL